MEIRHHRHTWTLRTGLVDFAALFEVLQRHGYRDLVAAEYRPRGTTRDTLGWAADFKVPSG